MENLNQNEIFTKYLQNIIQKTEAKKKKKKKKKKLKVKNHVLKIISHRILRVKQKIRNKSQR